MATNPLGIDLNGKNLTPALAEINLASPGNFIVTSFSLDVNRNFLGETYAYSNTYAMNLQGVIKDYAGARETISTSITGNITKLFDKSKFDFKVKSLSFTPDTSTTINLIKTIKFSISLEVRHKTENHTDFTSNSVPIVLAGPFNNILPQKTIEPFGAKLKDISESFNVDEGENGEGTFTHSINFSLLGDQAAIPPVGPAGGATPIRPDATYFRSNATSIVTELTDYSTFVNLTSLFAGTNSKFKTSFFTENQNFIHSETFDLFNFSYSLTRTKKFHATDKTGGSFSHNYSLTVGQDGIIEVTEETKIEGKQKTFASAKALLDSNDVEGSGTSITGHNNHLYQGVKNSYNRCKDFLNKNRKLLRYNPADLDAAKYTTSSSDIDSLRPFATSKTITTSPNSPSIVYTIKYSTNPNINFGFESNEDIKVSRKGNVCNVTHSYNIKIFNLKTGDFGTFAAALALVDSGGSSGEGITNIKTLSQKRSLRSWQRVHEIINSTHNPTSPFDPLSSYIGLFADTKKGTQPVALALIGHKTTVANRGKTFSLSLNYSNEHKYAPLYFNQKTADYNEIFGVMPQGGPARATLFTKAGIPSSAHQPISDKFSTFEVKINKKLPVEKFSERIIINKPDALIAPSFASSTGTISVVFSGKLRRNLINPDPNIYFKFKANNLCSYIKNNIVGGGIWTSLKTLAASIIDKELDTPRSSAATNVMGSAIQNIARAPISANYKYDSDYNFEFTLEIEFYGKHNAVRPIFVHGNDSIT